MASRSSDVPILQAISNSIQKQMRLHSIAVGTTRVVHPPFPIGSRSMARKPNDSVSKLEPLCAALCSYDSVSKASIPVFENVAVTFEVLFRPI